MNSMTSLDNVLVSPNHSGSLYRLNSLVDLALKTVEESMASNDGPVRMGGPAAAKQFAAEVLSRSVPREPAADPIEVFRDIIDSYSRWAINISHPATVARMQCPPTHYAVAADLVASALNQSLHAWEAGPFALELERHLVAQLTELIGYDDNAGGTMTAGGSISNTMAVLLARDEAIAKRFGVSGAQRGVASLGVRPVMLCSSATHFSIARAASLSGIGFDGIIRLPSDRRGRIQPDEAERVLSGLPATDLPVIVIACVGSTDQGWVDPLHELADICQRHGVWLHADAAYGGGMAFSDRLRHRLDGIELADSVTMDLHKFGWTHASSGVFLVRRREHLEHLSAQSTSLNVPDDVSEGYVGLYADSLQATRRADALKVVVNLATLGREGMGAMVDACCNLAQHAAARVSKEPKLELADPPEMSAVMFRYLPDSGDADEFNATLRRQLLADGTAALARSWSTNAEGVTFVYLKLMLLNPMTTAAQLDQVIDVVISTGQRLEAKVG